MNAELEIDYARGVIYVHDAETGETLLRICRLPAPIPLNVGLIDITHMVGAAYSPRAIPPEADEPAGTTRVVLHGVPKDLPPGTYPVSVCGVEYEDIGDGRSDIVVSMQFNPEETK